MESTHGKGDVRFGDSAVVCEAACYQGCMQFDVGSVLNDRTIVFMKFPGLQCLPFQVRRLQVSKACHRSTPHFVCPLHDPDESIVKSDLDIICSLQPS